MEQWEQDQYRREQAVRKAVETADRIIMDASNSNEETNYLTGRVAEEFLKKAIIPFSSELNKLALLRKFI